jgi:hypothetical protein
MTFIRTLIAAILIVALGDANNWHDFLGVIVVAWIAWSFTTDPLPAAINRGLEAFKERHQR